MPVDLRCKHDREVRARAADLFGTVKDLSQIFSRTQVSHRRNGDVFCASTSLGIDTSR